MSVCVFQTPTSKKRGFWHILEDINERRADPICGSTGYYFGGYHRDKPEMTIENLPLEKYSGTQKLCPSCVMQAYKKGWIQVVFVKRPTDG